MVRRSMLDKPYFHLAENLEVLNIASLTEFGKPKETHYQMNHVAKYKPHLLAQTFP